MVCLFNNLTHRVVTVSNSGTAIELTVTDSTNIGNGEIFNLAVFKPVSALVTGEPIPVTVTINGVAGIPVKNAFGEPLLSNVVPWGKTYGRFVMGGDTTSATTSYVILKTPYYA
jgi:hypothetical protein